MITILNRDEILSAVVQNMGSLFSGVQDAQVGFIKGELVAVISVNEEIPDDFFEEDDQVTVPDTNGPDSDDADSDTEANQDSSSDDTDSAKSSKQSKKRKRRTRAEIEADEAAAKESPEQDSDKDVGKAEPVQQAEAVGKSDDTPPFDADPKAETQSADDSDIFTPTPTADESTYVESSDEDEDLFSNAEPDPQVGANPFPSNDGEDNLFVEPEAEVKPVTETEGGFAKPREDESALDLFQ